MPRRLHSKIYVLSRYGNSFERFIHQKRTYQIFELRIGIQEFSNVTFIVKKLKILRKTIAKNKIICRFQQKIRLQKHLVLTLLFENYA